MDVVDSASQAPVGSTSTDFAGAYAFDLPEGTYDVRVTPPLGSQFQPTSQDGLQLNADTQLNFVLVPAGVVHFGGVLRDWAGSPVDGYVSLYNTADSSQSQENQRTSAGAFSFAVAPGEYRIYLQSGGNVNAGLPHHWAMMTQPLSVSADRTQDLTLPRPVSLSVHVADPSGNGVPSNIRTGGVPMSDVDLGGGIHLTSNASSGDGDDHPTDAQGDVSLLFFPSSASLPGQGLATATTGSYSPTHFDIPALTQNTIIRISLQFSTPTKVSTATVVSCSPEALAVGQSTVCTAIVTDVNSQTMPSGMVSFSSDGAGAFDGTESCTLSGGTCQVSYTPSTVGTGAHQLTANYRGDSTHAPSSGSTDLAVTVRLTSTSVSCVPESVQANSQTTCAVTLRDVDGGTRSTPTGIVTFSSDSAGAFGGAGMCTLVGGSCQLSYTPSAGAFGMHQVTVRYAGDSSHAASNASTTVVVVRSTSTSISCTGPAVVGGRSTTCTATVKDISKGNKGIPTGTVKFTSNGAGSFGSAGECTLIATNVSSAKCSLDYAPTAVGSGVHIITGTYGGDDSHASSGGSREVTVR